MIKMGKTFGAATPRRIAPNTTSPASSFSGFCATCLQNHSMDLSEIFRHRTDTSSARPSRACRISAPRAAREQRANTPRASAAREQRRLRAPSAQPAPPREVQPQTRRHEHEPECRFPLKRTIPRTSHTITVAASTARKPAAQQRHQRHRRRAAGEALEVRLSRRRMPVASASLLPGGECDWPFQASSAIVARAVDVSRSAVSRSIEKCSRQTSLRGRKSDAVRPVFGSTPLRRAPFAMNSQRTRCARFARLVGPLFSDGMNVIHVKRCFLPACARPQYSQRFLRALDYSHTQRGRDALLILGAFGARCDFISSNASISARFTRPSASFRFRSRQNGAAVLFVEEVVQAALDALRRRNFRVLPALEFDRDAHGRRLPDEIHNCNATMRRFFVSATSTRIRESAVRPHGVANCASPVPELP